MQPFTSSRVTKRDSSFLLSSGGEKDGPPNSAMALAAGEVLLATLDDAELWRRHRRFVVPLRVGVEIHVYASVCVIH